ncbi:hypothetical protein KIW84_012625 [Lathyrus oleraceus]|uniref:Myosin motor domain-containing protein n=1 Tax=Pisum sativum TaxID=3888 RepID=A0A9D5BI87_PEA|nr:hypothetical protein KIW84_012625 [Pisum sativum]
MMAQYRGARFGELSPYPFAVADAAYGLMINDGINQSILVSGESGVVKTENTKLLMLYLSYMGGRVSVAEGRTVEQKVLESNPVLEAFGNAKTVRNNNSSQFATDDSATGKLIHKNPARNQLSVCLNKTMHQDGGGSSSGGSQEMATSGAKKRQASPPILDVNKLMSKRRLVNMQKMMVAEPIFWMTK